MPERDLLDALARVLDDGYDLPPPPNRVAAVRANVERRRAAANGNGAARPDPAAVPAPVPVPETIAEPVPRPTPIESRRPRRPGRYVLVAAAAAAVFVVGILLGHGMPGPVRQVAHAVAPAWVESPDLHAARGALDDLGRALSAGDVAGACAADAEMLTLVDRLDEREREKIVPVAHEVHERAVAFVGPDGCTE